MTWRVKKEISGRGNYSQAILTPFCNLLLHLQSLIGWRRQKGKDGTPPPPPPTPYPPSFPSPPHRHAHTQAQITSTHSHTWIRMINHRKIKKNCGVSLSFLGEQIEDRPLCKSLSFTLSLILPLWLFPLVSLALCVYLNLTFSSFSLMLTRMTLDASACLCSNDK